MTDPIQFPQLLGPKAAERPDAPSSGTASKPPGAAGKDFKTVLLQSLDEVNRLQSEADAGVERLITGETDNVAEVFTAVNKAGIAFDLLMEARNRLVDAYQEIQQMRL
ncbi:MAG: flagellar hook-basal body complex protein FliE [Phycisphaerae bacterium]